MQPSGTVDTVDLADEFYEDTAFPRDSKVDEAKEALLRFFAEHADDVFYHRQLTVFFEKEFFHWITGKALKELSDEGRLQVASIQVAGWTGKPMRFYFSPRLRYWRRDAQRKARLVMRFSDSSFGRALGHHGEAMVDAALPRVGFMPLAKNVREFGGREWSTTGHNLDRVFTKDGLNYGTEVKNTLDYVPREELDAKLGMCAYLGLVPLFIVRMAPASYIEKVREAGGFTLVMKYQLYPYGQDEFAREVREKLGLPVDCPAAIQDGTLARLKAGHERLAERVNR